MNNELLLIISTIFIYSSVVLFYRFLGKNGLYCWTVLATLAANIEVLIVVDAFGMEQTLGNILFASTFLVTDILSETQGKKEAQKSVNIGIFVSLLFMALTLIWQYYIPSVNDWALSSINTLFAITPRMILVSILVYIIVQKFDVWFYHTIWEFT